MRRVGGSGWTSRRAWSKLGTVRALARDVSLWVRAAAPGVRLLDAPTHGERVVPHTRVTRDDDNRLRRQPEHLHGCEVNGVERAHGLHWKRPADTRQHVLSHRHRLALICKPFEGLPKNSHSGGGDRLSFRSRRPVESICSNVPPLRPHQVGAQRKVFPNLSRRPGYRHSML